MNPGNIFGIAVSALSAYRTRLNVTANNIANANTEGFRPSETMMNENLNGGVSAAIRQFDIPDVDIAKEMVDLMTTELGFKAMLKTISTEDEITSSIINIKI
ncbi:MAG: hypothetical protein HZA15_09420 [Nitrospirae bacterium]|nr:hypothetical protein [Nitrospirota bacterium]